MTQIQTYTGKVFDYAEPTADMICIEDIAHALALQVRYAGHCDKFYSVAQHSILCAMVGITEDLPNAVIMQCLMHDASEAYMGDLPKPLKELLPSYNCYEAAIHRAIMDKYGIAYPFDTAVKRIDHRVLATEAPVLLGELGPAWERWRDIPGYGDFIKGQIEQPWGPTEDVSNSFIGLFIGLGGEED